ncbi:MAG TPA: TonB-dependent receptor [Cytophagales bacterium]|nr:TonB-dependent receptor [Cytophagales bacterium]
MKKITLFILLFFAFYQQLFSQSSGLSNISVDYNNKPLADVLSDIEAKYKVHFFYKEEWLKDKLINVKADQVTIFEVMRLILKGTSLTFVYYKPYVILLKGDVEKDYPEIITKDSLSSENNKPIVLYTPTNREFRIVRPSKAEKGKTVRLTGKITERSTGEAVIGATVMVEELKLGVVSDVDGFYSIDVPGGNYTFIFSSLGNLPIKRNMEVASNKIFNVEMDQGIVQMDEVTIYGEAEDRNVSKADMSKTRLTIKAIKKMPAFMGEVDVLKSVTSLPGVTTVGEGSSGLNVRGGSVDQNLVLFDDAPLYNANHMFGLFSVFNPDVIKDVTLYRGSIPAQYGGRVSSVLDIRSKDVTAKKITGRGGLGLVASRLSLEGPVIKEKLTFLVAARGSWADPFLKLSKNKSIRNTSAYFYDINAKIDYKIDDKNKVFLSGYHGKDAFSFAADSIVSLEQNASPSEFEWENTNATLRWGHIFNKNLFSNVTAVYSNYSSSMRDSKDPVKYTIPSSIDYKSLKLDFTYIPNQFHKVDFGISSILYDINPPQLTPDSGSNIDSVKIASERGVESAIYINDEFEINHIFTLAGGIRYSDFMRLGEGKIYQYKEGQPLQSPMDSVYYGKNKVIDRFFGLEPRLSLKISITPESSVKMGYTRTRQYIQLISNTTSVVPSDRWKLADRYVLPQIGDQYAIGYFRNFLFNLIETSVEAYYKDIKNIKDYKNGSKLLLSEAIETDIITGKGRAYGVEFLIKKTKGKLTGWASYTYSKTEILANGQYDEEVVNEGQYYPANYDKPHFINVAINYQRNKRWNIAANFTYSTGRPISVPDSKYMINNVIVANFPERNNSRIPDYHRLDLSATVEPNHRKNKKWEGSWTFSIYNVYNRKNAYSVFFVNKEAYKLSVLGAAFPSITYNFKF